jgi:hypothetical protein
MKNDEIKNKWSEYFDNLFNEESEKTMIELDVTFDDTNKRLFREFNSSRWKKL